MSDISPNFQRGFLIPFDLSKENIDKTLSLTPFSEKDLTAGTAEAGDNVKQVVECTGTQQNTIDIKTVKGGTAGRGAGFAWKRSTDTNYYGSNSPTALSDYHMLQYPTGSNDFESPSALVTSKNDILVAYIMEDGSNNNELYVQRKTANSTQWTDKTANLVDSGKRTGSNVKKLQFPAMCELLDGSIILVVWRSYASTADGAQLYVYRSVDDGESFDLVSAGALDTPLDTTIFTVGKIHLAQYEGQILLIAESTQASASSNQNVAFQAASIDEGMTFTEIGSTEDNDFVYKPQIVVTNSGFLVTWISNDNEASVYLLTNAFNKFKTAVTGGVQDITNERVAVLSGGSPSIFTEGEHVSWIDERGVVFAAFRNTSLNSHTNGGDGGLWCKASITEPYIQWDFVGAGASPADSTEILPYIFSMNNDSICLDKMCAVYGQGCTYIFGNVKSTQANITSSVIYVTLAGYSTVNLKPRINDGSITQQAGWHYTYIPIDFPNNNTTVALVQTAGSSQLTSEGLEIQTFSSTDNRYYSYSAFPSILNTDVETGITVRFFIRPVSGGTVVYQFNRFVSLQYGSGSSGYGIQLLVDTTTLRLYDPISSSALATVTPSGTFLTDTGVEVIMSSANGKVSAWYREADLSSEKSWLVIGEDLSLTDNGSLLINQVQFGHRAATQSLETIFKEFFIAAGMAVANPIAEGFSNPADLNAIAYPAYGSFQYVTEGMSITTKDSPAYETDTYTVVPQSAYGIENIFLSSSPTPSKQWISTGSSGTKYMEAIDLVVDPNGEEIKFDTDLLGIHLNNINFREFFVSGYDVDAGTWTALKAVDTADGQFELDFTRHGKTIVGTGTGNNPYFFHDELAGAIVELGTGSGKVIREIVSNSEGSWTGSGNVKPAVITLKGTETTDLASGSCKILPKSVTLAIQLKGRTFSAIGIQMFSQATLTGDFRIGSYVVGCIHIVAPQYSRGRQVQFTANTQESESIDGIRRGRKVGEGKRQFQIQWSEPIDMSSVFPYDSPSVPDYYTSSTSAGSVAIANYGDAPFNFIGYIKKCSGSAKPVVFLPSIERSTSTSTDFRMYRRYNEHALVTFPNDISIEHVVGSEFRGSGTGECFRISTLQMLEVI